jgi:hypothetical protein
MDKEGIDSLKQALAGGNISAALPYLIDLSLDFGLDIPDDIASEMDAQDIDWRYYNIMVHYAIQWYRLGFSPAKLKKLMNDAIMLLSGQNPDSGKRSAMGMFMEYLQYKKEIDAHLARRLKE